MAVIEFVFGILAVVFILALTTILALGAVALGKVILAFIKAPIDPRSW